MRLKTISALLIMFFIFGLINLSYNKINAAEDTIVISVDEVEGEPGDIVEVPVRISHIPSDTAFPGVQIEVMFDNKVLELVGYETGTIPISYQTVLDSKTVKFADFIFTQLNTANSNGKLVAVYIDFTPPNNSITTIEIEEDAVDENKEIITEENQGILYTMQFKIKEDIKHNELPLSIFKVELVDQSGNSYKDFDKIDGKIKIPSISLTDEEAVNAAKDSLTLQNLDHLINNIVLPTKGLNGTTIEWESSKPEIISNEGIVTRPESTQLDTKVTLTATISKGDVSDTKEFVATVIKKESSRIVLDERDFEGGASPGITLPPVVVSKVSSVFDDIYDVPWAAESIKELAEKGIIAGMGGNKFKPNDTLTREQFIKLLVAAFDLMDENVTSDFTDVEEDAWYYPYIASAQQAGITNGMGDGRFGVGLGISRQEMAAMIYRLAKESNITLPRIQEAVEFADQDEIAEYAKESVAIMQQAGIINGIGDNKFDPKGSCTRAMAAKVIYELLKY